MIHYPPITIIIGSGRSGTSYLQRTLRESMDIGFYREPKYIIPTYFQLRRYGDLQNPANLRRLVEKIYTDQIFTHLNQVDQIPLSVAEILDNCQEPSFTGVLYAIFQLIAEKQGMPYLGYKFPSDVKHLLLLAKIFPTARFVHSIRDGRDVAISLLKFDWGPTNLYSGARYWASRTALGRAEGARLGERYHEFRFEDLLHDTPRVAPALGAFIAHGEKEERVQAFIDQVEKTKKPDIAYGWRKTLDRQQIQICEAAAGQELSACGYPLEFGGQARLTPLLSTVYLTRDVLTRGLTQLNRRVRD